MLGSYVDGVAVSVADIQHAAVLFLMETDEFECTGAAADLFALMLGEAI